MIDVLQEWGYTPELKTSDGGRTAEITPGPTAPSSTWPARTRRSSAASTAASSPGSLAQLGERGARVSLEPFVDDTTCIAQVEHDRPRFRTAASKEHS